MKNEGLADRVGVLRKRLGLTFQGLAKASGIASGFLHDVEHGKKSPGSEALLALARALDVSCDYLLTGHDPPARLSPDDLPQPELHFADSLPADIHDRMRREDFLAVPLVEDRVAAGAPADVRDAIEGWAIVYRPLVGKRSNLVAVRVRGNSMSPVLPEGSVAVVDRGDRRVVRGGLYVVLLDGGVTVKYVSRERADLVLIPENREHRETRVAIREGEPDPIVGRVVWSWRVWI